MKSAAQHAREQAWAEIDTFLTQCTATARQRYEDSLKLDALPSERLSEYERGIYGGAIVANETIQKWIRHKLGRPLELPSEKSA